MTFLLLFLHLPFVFGTFHSRRRNRSSQVKFLMVFTSTFLLHFLQKTHDCFLVVKTIIHVSEDRKSLVYTLWCHVAMRIAYHSHFQVCCVSADSSFDISQKESHSYYRREKTVVVLNWCAHANPLSYARWRYAQQILDTERKSPQNPETFQK